VVYTRRTSLAISLAFLLLAIVNIPAIEFAVGNPTTYSYVGPSMPDTSLPKLEVALPENNTIYNVTDISYSLTIEKPSSWFDYDNYNGQIFSVVYYLDNSPKVTIAEKEFDSVESLNSQDPITLQGALTGLSEGDHIFQVFVYGVCYYQDPNQPQGVPSNYYLDNNCTAYFTVDTTPPSVSILSPQDANYNSTEISLNYYVSEPTSRIGYSIDGASNITITGNSTLTGLLVGEHNLTVYTWDVAGNIGTSQTIKFAVAHQETEPFPTTLVITASGASLAAIGIGLLVYWKNHKRQIE
jgi:hypothetical protein